MTKKKQFDLHQVLSYRTDVEKVRRQEFAVAKRDLEDACDQLAQEQDELKALNKEFSELHGQFESIVDLQMYNDFFTRKKEEIKQQQGRVDELGQLMDERREQMVLATKDKKVLEALKEKKDLAFKQEQQQKERDFLDEISVQKKGRE